MRAEPLRRLAVRALAGGGCLLLLAGCSSFRCLWRTPCRPQPVRRADEAVRAPVPCPYLLVRGGREGEPLDFQIVYLPDATAEIHIEPRGRFGKGPLRVTFDEAGFLREVSGRFKSRRVTVISSPPAGEEGPPPVAAVQLGDLARGNELTPGLYRIVAAEDGSSPTPWLEKVPLYPSLPESLRVAAILFRTCPERPEVVQRIEITADSGSLTLLGALAPEVRVYRDRKPVDVAPEIRQRGLVFAVDPDCRGDFSGYSVQLPSDRLAPGSVLEAAFPTPEQLARLRPRAEVHLVRDARDAPRYLVIQLDPGEGSPVPPPERLDRLASLLLVNGKAAKLVRIVREMSAEGLYAVDLGEPEVRSVFFSMIPRNAANLPGLPASFNYTRPEPTPSRPERPPPITVRETTLETAHGRHHLTLGIAAPAGRVDTARTVALNGRQGWKGVRCGSLQGPEITCSGAIDAGGGIEFRIYCTGEEPPCLAVDFSR